MLEFMENRWNISFSDWEIDKVDLLGLNDIEY